MSKAQENRGALPPPPIIRRAAKAARPETTSIAPEVQKQNESVLARAIRIRDAYRLARKETELISRIDIVLKSDADAVEKASQVLAGADKVVASAVKPFLEPVAPDTLTQDVTSQNTASFIDGALQEQIDAEQKSSLFPDSDPDIPSPVQNADEALQAACEIAGVDQNSDKAQVIRLLDGLGTARHLKKRAEERTSQDTSWNHNPKIISGAPTGTVEAQPQSSPADQREEPAIEGQSPIDVATANLFQEQDKHDAKPTKTEENTDSLELRFQDGTSLAVEEKVSVTVPGSPGEIAKAARALLDLDISVEDFRDAVDLDPRLAGKGVHKTILSTPLITRENTTAAALHQAEADTPLALGYTPAIVEKSTPSNQMLVQKPTTIARSGDPIHPKTDGKTFTNEKPSGKKPGRFKRLLRLLKK